MSVPQQSALLLSRAERRSRQRMKTPMRKITHHSSALVSQLSGKCPAPYSSSGFLLGAW